MKVKPLKTEKKPIPTIHWSPKDDSVPHKVRDNETWHSVVQKFGVERSRHFSGSPVEYLIYFNFSTRDPDEVNWYLREFVGCNVSKDGGNNWAFSDSADPGIIYVPHRIRDFEEGEGSRIAGNQGINGNAITVPQYDDSNFLDALSKALDVMQMVELFQALEITLPMLVEGGLIALGVIGAIGPTVAVAAPHADALKARTREYFFEGFAAGLVMSANGASERYIRKHREMLSPPMSGVYSEKAGTFRKLHNAGLTLGIKKGKQFNVEDKRKFFVYLHKQIRGIDQFYYTSGSWENWSDNKKKNYYDLMISIVKNKMIKNNLQLKIK